MESFLNTAGSYLVTAIASILIFGVVIFIHELGHFLAAKYSGITVHEFALGMGPTLFKWGKKETTYALRLFPIGGFVSMEGEDEESNVPGSFTNAPVGNRILVVVAGAIMNLLLGFLILVFVVCSEDAITSKTVSGFYEGATTQASGLQVGDTVVAVNGRRCFIMNDIFYEFARTQDGKVDLTVERDGKPVELPAVQFQVTEENGEQSIHVDFTVLPAEKNFFTVTQEAFHWTLSYGRVIVLSLVDMVRGRIAINNLSGPVGIVSAISEASSYGLGTLLLLAALITINLGIFNLLPLPALDGGRLLFLLIEAVRRKRLNPKYEMVVNAIGFVLLIGLVLFATFNDITRLFG